jgi:hypothetical protein
MAPKNEEAKIVMAEGADSYTLANDGRGDIFKIKRSKSREPVVVIDGTGRGDTSFTLNRPDLNLTSDTTLTVNAMQGQEARLTLTEGSDSYSISHDGGDESLAITRGGITTPIVTIATPAASQISAIPKLKNSQAERADSSCVSYLSTMNLTMLDPKMISVHHS